MHLLIRMRLPLALTLALSCSSVFAATPGQNPAADADGFVSMFNGRDLSGWTNINCAPETWSVRDGMIVCTGKPTGGLRTTRHYENFVLELEWRHLTSGGNSGVFVWGSPINAPGVPFLRGIEVQALDHGYAVEYERKNGKKSDSFTVHGDVFPIHGATMKPIGRTNGRRGFPSEERSKPSPEWNHYKIVANNGSIRLHVNGKEVSGGDDCNYRRGYLALESEGAPVEFRNIRIKELPSSNPAPELVAPLDPGWRALFNGLDLRGWQTSTATAQAWHVVNEKIQLKPDGGAPSSADAPLWTTDDFGDAEFIVDFQPPAARAANPTSIGAATVLLRGRNGEGMPVVLSGASPGKFSRFVITVRGRSVTLQRDGGPTTALELPAASPARGAFGLARGAGVGSFMNLHVRPL